MEGDRKYFKVIATFSTETDSTGTVSLEAAYPDVINLHWNCPAISPVIQ